MNIEKKYKIQEERILNIALEAVARTTELDGKVGNYCTKANKPLMDASIIFRFGQKKINYSVEIKSIDSISSLGLLKIKFEKSHMPCLLVAPYITAKMAKNCREMGIQFIDTAGNAYLKEKDLYIFVIGHKRNLKNIPSVKNRAATTTGMRVVFVLLCEPKLINASYRDIAKAAGVALGSVGWVFYALKERGHLLGEKKKKRRFINPKGLIEEWVINYSIKLRSKLRTQCFSGPNDNWWRNLDLKKYGALFGGEIAGDILTHYRKPSNNLLYMEGDLTRFVIDNHLRADVQGSVEIVEKFWNFNFDDKRKQIVPP
ncbi:MAG: type IV toxin-antitoxin system AbiEi family antitoxin, partial [Elusimicrobiota bacterium]|nr:type IV toxin-antitoxin system AbiEi family antitoxin [Elusimicrobiota bacterium]